MKCLAVYCDFEGTQEEVDEHLVYCISISDPDHAHLTLEPLERPFEERLDTEERNDG